MNRSLYCFHYEVCLYYIKLHIIFFRHFICLSILNFLCSSVSILSSFIKEFEAWLEFHIFTFIWKIFQRLLISQQHRKVCQGLEPWISSQKYWLVHQWSCVWFPVTHMGTHEKKGLPAISVSGYPMHSSGTRHAHASTRHACDIYKHLTCT